jgi:hypothetical protein
VVTAPAKGDGRVVVRVLLNNAITPVSEVERTVQYVQKYAADNGLTEAVPKAAPKRRPPQGEARDGGCDAAFLDGGGG